jgi:hypothetical protein
MNPELDLAAEVGRVWTPPGATSARNRSNSTEASRSSGSPAADNARIPPIPVEQTWLARQPHLAGARPGGVQHYRVVIRYRLFEVSIWPDQVALPGPQRGRPRPICWQPWVRGGPVLV